MPVANAYGTTNPRGLEPNPIETTLASLASGGSAADAGIMLNHYQAQRAAAEGEYGADLQQQHQYAYDQLHNQMVENQLKALVEAPKTAGTLDLLQGSGLVPGINPNIAGGIETNLARLQNATIAEKGGAGAASAASAGAALDPADVSGITGLKIAKMNDPVALQAAKLKLQGDLARASASRAGGANKDTVTTLRGPNDEPLTVTTVQHGPINSTNLGHNPAANSAAGPAANSGLTMAQSGAGAPSTRTTPPPATTGSSGRITPANLQQARVSNPPAYNDIMQRLQSQNGQPTIGPNGGLVGARGVEY